MPINKESLNRKLEKALGRYRPKAVNDQDKVVPLADEADAFRFNFVKNGEDYGVVYATLDDTNTLTIWFDDEIMDSPDSKTPGLDYDDTWFGFLKFIKRWAMNNQLSFKTDNKDHLGSEMARRKRMKEKEKIAEGYYPMGKKASYSDAVPSVKIILQHSKVMQEGEQRFRHIEKIFVENANGERFLVPTTKPGLARVFARHIAEGGTPYDERASHIQSLVEEYNKMAGFVRATRNGQFNESAQQLVQEGINHYLSLRESLGKLTGHRGYTAYFENWTPSLMEDESDASAINELFVQETLDPRIESVMPILSRLHKQVSEMKEVDELSEWADSLLSEKMVMGADSDASSSGTVFAEDEGIQSQNPAGIPEEELDEEKKGLWANIHAKRARIKAGSGERMRKPGSKGAPSAQDFKDAAKTSNEGLGDVAKKIGSGIKKAAGKALDVVAPGDEELLRRLQKSAGVRGMNHGKPSMAHSEVEKKVDEEHNQEVDLSNYKEPSKFDYKGMEKKIEIPAYQRKAAGIKPLDVKDVAGTTTTVKPDPKNMPNKFEKGVMKVMGLKDPTELELEEDLGPEQTAVGQLGPTEKVGKKGAVGKLVGANEGVEQKTIGNRQEGFPRFSGGKPAPEMPKSLIGGPRFSGGGYTGKGVNPATAEDSHKISELKKSTVKSYADKKQAELDDVPPMPFKKSGMSKAEHEKAAKGMMGALARLSDKKPTSEDVTEETKSGKPKKDFAKMFQKNIDKTNKEKKDTDEKVKQHQEVKEGQEDLDAILRIIRK